MPPKNPRPKVTFSDNVANYGDPNSASYIATSAAKDAIESDDPIKRVESLLRKRIGAMLAVCDDVLQKNIEQGSASIAFANSEKITKIRNVLERDIVIFPYVDDVVLQRKKESVQITLHPTSAKFTYDADHERLFFVPSDPKFQGHVTPPDYWRFVEENMYESAAVQLLEYFGIGEDLITQVLAPSRVLATRASANRAFIPPTQRAK
jgi:hypothetical protein